MIAQLVEWKERTNMRFTNISVIILIILSFTPASAEENIYSIHESKDGRVFRLNHQSGDIYLIKQDGLLHLSESNIILQIGRYYRTEKGYKKYLKYLGNGEFESSKYAVSITP